MGQIRRRNGTRPRAGGNPNTGKSTLWTHTGQDWNFQRTLSAIGPYKFRGQFIWTNHWSMPFPGEIRMDQWSWKFFQSFPLHWYWCMDGSSQKNGEASRNSFVGCSLVLRSCQPPTNPDFQSSWKWQKIGQKVPKSYFMSPFCHFFWAYFGVCSVFFCPVEGRVVLNSRIKWACAIYTPGLICSTMASSSKLAFLKRRFNWRCTQPARTRSPHSLVSPRCHYVGATASAAVPTTTTILLYLRHDVLVWKITPWELSFVIFEGFCALEMSRK